MDFGCHTLTATCTGTTTLTSPCAVTWRIGRTRYAPWQTSRLSSVQQTKPSVGIGLCCGWMIANACATSAPARSSTTSPMPSAPKATTGGDPLPPAPTSKWRTTSSAPTATKPFEQEIISLCFDFAVWTFFLTFDLSMGGAHPQHAQENKPVIVLKR